MLKSKTVQKILLLVAICMMLLLSMSYVSPCCFEPTI
jgi:hypothetical protein